MRYFGLVRELDPDASQVLGIRQAIGACRFAQNVLLASVKSSLDLNEPRSWTVFALQTDWRAMRDEVAPWHSEVSSEAFKYGADRTARALKNWADSRKGKRSGPTMGFPKFRKRGRNDSCLYFTAQLRPCGQRVLLPRIGEIRLKEPVVLKEGEEVLAAVVRERAGRCFVTFRIRQPEWSEPAKRNGKTVGVDFGVGDRFATLSDGTVIENPRFLRSAAKKLARAHRDLSRKQTRSNNQAKAGKRAAKLQYRTACKRKDFLHKFTTDLVKNHAVIVIEDLNLKGMSNRKGFRLGKSVQDVALYEARRQIEYKASWYGATVIVASRWYPSSKTCSTCGEVNTMLSLSERVWACCCGVTNDRDLNAAINLRNLAGGSLVSARGEDIRPAQLAAGLVEAGNELSEFGLVL